MTIPGLPCVTALDLPQEVVLVDVREPEEWAAGHAPEAVHIPLRELPDRWQSLPLDGDVVVVCHLGGRSAQATAWLTQQGVACRNLTGGMVAYAAAGHAVVSDTGRPPVVD